MRPWGFLPLIPLVCSGRAEAPCVIAAGEVTSVSDPRWHDPTCYIEVGAQLRVYIEEIPPPTRIRLDVHPSCAHPRPLTAQGARVRAYLLTQGVLPENVTERAAPCADPARIDAVVTTGDGN